MGGIKFVIPIAVLLVVSSALADNVRRDKKKSEISDVSDWLKSVEAVVRAHSDPARRAIVCRVPFTDLSITALVAATKIPRLQIMMAVSALKAQGLVELSKNIHGHQVVIPANNHARDKMRKWAYDWCASDDACDVKK